MLNCGIHWQSAHDGSSLQNCKASGAVPIAKEVKQ
jgi:hypothetical protein